MHVFASSNDLNHAYEVSFPHPILHHWVTVRLLFVRLPSTIHHFLCRFIIVWQWFRPFFSWNSFPNPPFRWLPITFEPKLTYAIYKYTLSRRYGNSSRVVIPTITCNKPIPPHTLFKRHTMEGRKTKSSPQGRPYTKGRLNH